MDLVAGVSSAKVKYPTNAPTATASMTMPLYVMKRSLAREGMGSGLFPSRPGGKVKATHIIKKL
jgi:hypothetical protein